MLPEKISYKKRKEKKEEKLKWNEFLQIAEKKKLQMQMNLNLQMLYPGSRTILFICQKQ